MKKLILAVALACAGAVFGETKTWTGGGDGTRWSDVANWDEKGAPAELGEWGAVGSGAAHESAHVTGEGRLLIAPPRGCAILVR